MSLMVRDTLQKISSFTVPIDELTDDDDLFDAGLSSFDLINLITCLETALDIEFPGDVMTREHFATVTSIDNTIASLEKSEAAP